jgi:hypothetical protein
MHFAWLILMPVALVNIIVTGLVYIVISVLACQIGFSLRLLV